MRSVVLSCISALLLGSATSEVIHAQEVVQVPPPGAGAPVGVRAAGMGGAFTAVADDASAVYWNPAGLASGAYLSLVLDRNELDQSSGTLFALGAPPVGLGYYRTETAGALEGPDKLVAYHTGITLVQNIGKSLAVGGMVKWVHGSAGGISTNKFDDGMSTFCRLA